MIPHRNAVGLDLGAAGGPGITVGDGLVYCIRRGD
jgi:hypothetical protein